MAFDESSVGDISKGPPALIFCAGGIGSGKSFLVKSLKDAGLNDGNTVFITFDQFIHDQKEVEDDFHGEKHGENQQRFLREREAVFSEALKAGKHIVMETHFENKQQIDQFIKAARGNNHRVVALGTLPSPASFFNLRRYKDKITPHTREGLRSQFQFSHAWEERRDAMDYTALFEREFDKHAEGLVLLQEAFNGPSGPRVLTHEPKRLKELLEGWEVISSQESGHYKHPEVPEVSVVGEKIHGTIGQRIHSPSP